MISYGDQALPRLPNGGLVRWMGTRGELHHLIGPMGFHHHFLYTSNGPSLGQWLVAHGAGGRLIAGAVRLSDRADPLGRLRAGEVIELRISNPAEAQVLLGRLRLSLVEPPPASGAGRASDAGRRRHRLAVSGPVAAAIGLHGRPRRASGGWTVSPTARRCCARARWTS